ncbi:LysR family transcriptional regulator [Cupriavidus basilensis]
MAVADAGNVSRGGATCFLAPSSASLRIKQLEQALGTPAVRAEARGVSLTRAGQVMLEHCRRCLAELEQMQRQPGSLCRRCPGAGHDLC